MHSGTKVTGHSVLNMKVVSCDFCVTVLYVQLLESILLRFISPRRLVIPTCLIFYLTRSTAIQSHFVRKQV